MITVPRKIGFQRKCRGKAGGYLEASCFPFAQLIPTVPPQ